jgi:hypothetical protein
MGETYAFPEGFLHVWTGLANASGAQQAFVQNIGLTMQLGWQTDASLSGTYRDHHTGRAAQLNVGYTYALSAYLPKLLLSATAVHFKFMMNHFGGSAGFIFYSGRLDAVNLAGAENGVFTYQVQAHANQWTAF